MFPSRLWRCAAAAAFAASLAGSAAAQQAEHPEIAKRRQAERRIFSDAEIVDGFLKIALSAEFHTGGPVDRIRKYDGPVRVTIENRARPDRTRQVAEAIAEIGKRVRHLDIAVTQDRAAANVVVRLVRDRDISKSIREIYGKDRARRILTELDPQCLSSFRKDTGFRIVQSDVLLATDAGEFTFRHCLYEEVLQALGPINDDHSVPWTMFNDDVQLGFFGVYDQYLLNILYDPRIRPGMPREEVRALLPSILPDVRAFVEKNNGLR